MCGHVGVFAGDLNRKELDVFRSLLIMDSLRGIHGTGVAGVDFSGNAELAKVGGDPFQLFDHKSYDKAVTVNKRVLIGHNRYATQGSHTAWNAHPFDFNRVVGAHNGTLPWNAKGNLVNHDRFDVDSEALINQINENLVSGMNPEEATREAIGRVHGAWALVLFFKKEKKLAFIRNKERPLFYCYTKDRKELYWASELWMLHSALARAGIDMEEKPYILPEDTLQMWDLPMFGKKIEAPTKSKMEGKQPGARVVTEYYGASAWEDDNIPFARGAASANRDARGSGRTSTPTTSSTSRPYPESVVDAPTGNGVENVHFLNRSVTDRGKKEVPFPNDNKNGHFKPPYKDAITGNVINKDEFIQRVRQGGCCVWCDNTPTYGEQVLFLRPDPKGTPQYLCQECLKDDQIMNICRGMR